MKTTTLVALGLLGVAGFLAFQMLSGKSLLTPAGKSAALLQASADRLSAGKAQQQQSSNLWATIALSAGNIAASYFGAHVPAGAVPEVNV